MQTNARALRNNPTVAEARLWYFLRKRQLVSTKFRRQYPIGHFIVDFVSISNHLVIELDGGHHNEDKIRNYDQERTAYLERSGYTVLRFWNNEVMDNIEAVVNKILESVTTTPNPSLKEGH